MEVRSDDFAGLLAALGKAPAPIQPNPQYYQQFAPQPMPQMPPAPQQYMYPPQTYPQYYQPPKPTSNNWVLIILICAVIAFGILAWMRSTRMQEPEDRAITREIPPPSTVTSVYEDWPAAKWPEPETVANNLLNFVKEHTVQEEKPDDVIDLSGVDLPLDTASKSVGGRISADDSQTVLNYAKRREALLEESP